MNADYQPPRYRDGRAMPADAVYHIMSDLKQKGIWLDMALRRNNEMLKCVEALYIKTPTEDVKNTYLNMLTICGRDKCVASCKTMPASVRDALTAAGFSITEVLNKKNETTSVNVSATITLEWNLQITKAGKLRIVMPDKMSTQLTGLMSSAAETKIYD